MNISKIIDLNVPLEYPTFAPAQGVYPIVAFALTVIFRVTVVAICLWGIRKVSILKNARAKAANDAALKALNANSKKKMVLKAAGAVLIAAGSALAIYSVYQYNKNGRLPDLSADLNRFVDFTKTNCNYLMDRYPEYAQASFEKFQATINQISSIFGLNSVGPLGAPERNGTGIFHNYRMLDVCSLDKESEPYLVLVPNFPRISTDSTASGIETILRNVVEASTPIVEQVSPPLSLLNDTLSSLKSVVIPRESSNFTGNSTSQFCSRAIDFYTENLPLFPSANPKFNGIAVGGLTVFTPETASPSAPQEALKMLFNMPGLISEKVSEFFTFSAPQAPVNVVDLNPYGVVVFDPSANKPSLFNSLFQAAGQVIGAVKEAYNSLNPSPEPSSSEFYKIADCLPDFKVIPCIGTPNPSPENSKFHGIDFAQLSNNFTNATL